MWIVSLSICVGCTNQGISAPTAGSVTVVASRTSAPSATPRPAPSPTPVPSPRPVPTSTALPTPVPTPGAIACGQTHGTMIHAQMRSNAMGHIETYRVYTPPCYDRQPERRYATLYLLHGGEHGEEHWDDIGVDDAADALIAETQIPPLLIVLPDGGEDFGPLRGDPPPFARYLRDELLAQIDATYRTLPDREHRALGGISYGAAWALLLAARYADTFSAVGAHSPAIGSFNGIYPDAQALCRGQLRLYIDVGTQDGLRRPAAVLRDALEQAGCTLEFHIYPGTHSEAYWNGHLQEYLRFYTKQW